MKRDFLYSGVLLIIIALAIGASCWGCGSPSSQSDASANSTAAVDVGNVDVGDVTATATGNTNQNVTNVEAETNVWDLINDLQKDWFWRSMLIVFILLWATGNLHPAKPLKLRDKKPNN